MGRNNTKIRKSFDNIRHVISQKNRLLTFLASTIIFFGAIYFLTLATTSGYSFQIFIMMNGLRYAVLTLFMSFVISLLFGLWFSLLIYRVGLNGSNLRANGPGFLGSSAGILGAGCPMCGSLILGLFGAPLGLFSLPFKGLEIKALSLIFLLSSVFIMSKDLDCKKCRHNDD